MRKMFMLFPNVEYLPYSFYICSFEMCSVLLSQLVTLRLLFKTSRMSLHVSLMCLWVSNMTVPTLVLVRRWSKLNWWKGESSGSIACTRKQQLRFFNDNEEFQWNWMFYLGYRTVMGYTFVFLSKHKQAFPH